MKFGFTKLQLAIWTVYMVVAINVFGLTLVIPVMATFTQYLGGTQRLVGTLYTVYAGCSLLSGLYVPFLSDKFGRRIIFLISAAGAAIAFAGSSRAENFLSFVIWRGIAGLFTGTIGTAYAYVADVVPPADKPRYMSYVSATMSTCFVIGPAIGGGLAAFGIRIPFYAGFSFDQ